jgi:predicted MFS family arabinose efflux permease
MNTTDRIRFSHTETLCLTAVLLLAFGASLGMAFNIDAIALSFGVGNSDAGLVATLEMASIAIGNLITARYVSRIAQHLLYLICIFVIASANALSIFAAELGWLILVRLPAGLALGALVATIMATAGRSSTPEQTFGLINASVGAMGIAVSYTLPRALQLGEVAPAQWMLSPADGLYATYTLAAVVAIGFIRFTPRPTPIATQPSTQQKGPSNRWMALLGLGLVFFGHALLAVFLVRIGRQTGLDAKAIGYVLMAAGAVGIVAPLLTGFFGARVPATPVVLALLAVMLISGLYLPRANTTAFALTAPIFAALPTAIMPVFLGAAAKVDARGQITAAHPAFVMLGGAAAPLIGGWVSDQGGFEANAYVAAVCIGVACVLITPILRGSDKLSHATSVHPARIAPSADH